MIHRYLGLPGSLQQLVESPASSSLLTRLLGRGTTGGAVPPAPPLALPSPPLYFRYFKSSTPVTGSHTLFLQGQSSTTVSGQPTVSSLLPSRQPCSPGRIVLDSNSKPDNASQQKKTVTGGLIPLPRDYTDLMNLAAEFTCPNNVSGPSAGEVRLKLKNQLDLIFFNLGEKSSTLPHLWYDGVQPERLL